MARQKVSPHEQILRDLEEVFQVSLKEGKYTAALKAKELLGKEIGLFGVHKPFKPTLSDFTEEDLKNLLKELEVVLQEDEKALLTGKSLAKGKKKAKEGQEDEVRESI